VNAQNGRKGRYLMDRKTESVEPPVDYSRKWYAMAAVGMGIFLGTIDASIVNIALPTLVRELQTKFSIVQWVVLSYLLTITTLMLGTGRLADIVGKKTLYIAGMAIFTTGSLLCALSPSVYWLIGARVFQGLGAVTNMALGAGIISEAFPPAERGKSLGIIGSMVSIGIVAGPVLGGLILDSLSWHWIFLVNLPVGIAGIIMAVKFIPYSRPRGGQTFDFTGALLLFVSVLSFLLALTMGQRRGFTDPVILVLFAVFALFLGVFIFTQLRIDHPLLNIRLFRHGLLSINFTMGFLSFVTFAGIILLMPFYLENILKLPPSSIGMILATIPLSAGIVSPFSGSISDRYGTWLMNALGLGFILTGYLVATGFNAETTIAGYIGAFIPMGIGLGTFQSPNNSAIMHSFPRDQYGVASSLLAVTRTLGQTTGIGLLGAFWAYRVSRYSGGAPGEGPSLAPIANQIAGLRDVFMLSALLVFVALVLALAGYARWRASQKNLSPHP
jgi:EmrB/QacA subfamily drug resistance transporter